MTNYFFQTPVVLIIYNRPDLVQKVMSSLRVVKPGKVYVIADGPKNKSEKKLVKQTRDIIKEINWNCNIKKNYSNKNLGLRKRIVSGLNWVFKNEKQVIILEDDCIADPSFFSYCEKLLNKYKNNKKIMSISGNNFQFGKNQIEESYYFSRYFHSWGWATWKRAWKKYDDDMVDWPKLKKTNWLKKILDSKVAASYWKLIFNKTKNNEFDSWAYRWTYSHFLHNGLSIIPKINLVSNIGHGNKATHTKRKSKTIKHPTQSISFPLKHPVKIIRHKKADTTTEKNVYLTPTITVSLIFRSIIKFKK